MVNTTAAIMAIPGPLEPIRLIGDEEKHATLLFFGETSSLPDTAKQTLIDAVEVASTMLFPFGETVVDVKRLGNDIPPALVALLTGDTISMVRNLFLMNPEVSGFRDNTPQYQGFTPHVTLSHPDFTDEAIQRALMQQVYRVRFDRLSVWWNDERLDFDLGPVQDNMSMADAVQNVAAKHALEDSDHLEHHGVKGMKWGVRKDAVAVGNPRGGGVRGVIVKDSAKASSPPSASELKSADKLVVKAQKATTHKDTMLMINMLNDNVKRDLAAGKYQWNAGAQKKYDNIVAQHLGEAAQKAVGKDVKATVVHNNAGVFTIAIGHPQAVATFASDFQKGVVVHADQGKVSTFTLTAVRDGDGLIVGFTDETGAEVMHSDMGVDDFLEHHGVKGQKWGVRKEGTTDHTVHVSVGRKPHVGDKLDNGGTSHTVVGVRKSGDAHIVTTRPSAAIQAERAARGRKIAHIFLKDKEYWQKAAAVAGVGLAGIGIAAAAPALVPASALAAGGGAALVSSKIALGTAIATRVGYAHNYVQWARRSGAAKKLAHDNLNEKRTIGQVYNDLTGEKRKAANILIDAYSRGEEFYNDPDVQTGWAEMTPTERNAVLFIASSTNPPEKAFAHSSIVEDDESVVWVPEGEAVIAHVSTKPWSDYTAADYTPEQYKAACLVVRGDGSTKAQCKLPVRTPDGALSKPGVHAAAAALAGARGGVDLTATERASAKTKLKALYKELGDTPPPSLAHALTALVEASRDDLQQHGIKGMKWGIRRNVDSATGRVEQTGTTGLKPRTGSADQIQQDRIQKKIDLNGVHSLSNAELQAYTRRLQMEKDVKRALQEQSAAQKAKADGFIKTFVKKQGARQTNRVVDKVLDVAVEKALEQAGINLGKKNPNAGAILKEASGRLKPKKK